MFLSSAVFDQRVNSQHLSPADEGSRFLSAETRALPAREHTLQSCERESRSLSVVSYLTPTRRLRNSSYPSFRKSFSVNLRCEYTPSEEQKKDILHLGISADDSIVVRHPSALLDGPYMESLPKFDDPNIDNSPPCIRTTVGSS